jgi:hypothetical protein
MSSSSSQLRLTQLEIWQRLKIVKNKQQFLTTSEGVTAAKRVTLHFLKKAKEALPEILKRQCKTHSLMGASQVSPW